MEEEEGGWRRRKEEGGGRRRGGEKEEEEGGGAWKESKHWWHSYALLLHLCPPDNTPKTPNNTPKTPDTWTYSGLCDTRKEPQYPNVAIHDRMNFELLCFVRPVNSIPLH